MEREVKIMSTLLWGGGWEGCCGFGLCVDPDVCNVCTSSLTNSLSDIHLSFAHFQLLYFSKMLLLKEGSTVFTILPEGLMAQKRLRTSGLDGDTNSEKLLFYNVLYKA